MLGRIADGELLESLYERFPEHDDLVENVAEILATLMFIPIVWSIWAIVAGVVDTVSVTERVGLDRPRQAPGRRHPRSRVGCGRSPTATATRCSWPSTTGRVESSPPGWPTSARPHPRARRRGSAPRRSWGTSARASRSVPPRVGINHWRDERSPPDDRDARSRGRARPRDLDRRRREHRDQRAAAHDPRRTGLRRVDARAARAARRRTT